MPKLTYQSTGFNTTQYPACDGEKTLDVPWSKIVWAAVTVGKAGEMELRHHGVYSRYERMMRLCLLKANWKESAAGMFQHTDVYKHLDASEKTAASYFAGLTIAKLLAHECLQVPWLQHYDGYLRSVGQEAKGKRPDLVGKNAKQEWFALEAKGRSAGPEANLMERALMQAEAVKPINGRRPLPIASIAYTKKAGILYATWEDPEPEQTDEAGYQIDPADFLNRYYEPIRSLIDAERQETTIEWHGNRTYTVRSFPDLDVQIGLMDDLLTRRILVMRALQDNPPPDETQSTAGNNRNTFIGGDGVLVSLGPSWEPETMRLEPGERLTA